MRSYVYYRVDDEKEGYGGLEDLYHFESQEEAIGFAKRRLEKEGVTKTRVTKVWIVPPTKATVLEWLNNERGMIHYIEREITVAHFEK